MSEKDTNEKKHKVRDEWKAYDYLARTRIMVACSYVAYADHGRDFKIRQETASRKCIVELW